MGCFTFIKVMMILFNLAIFVSAPQLLSLPRKPEPGRPPAALGNWDEGLGSAGAASGEHPELGWVNLACVGSPAPPCPFSRGWESGMLAVGETCAPGTPIGCKIWCLAPSR